MFTRQILAAAVVSISLAPGLDMSARVFAQSNETHMTATQRYDQGMADFKHGDYAKARQLLRHVDAMQLSHDDRVTLYHTLQALDKQSQTKAKPAPKAAAHVKPVAKPAKPAAAKPQAKPAAAKPQPTPAQRLAQADDLAAEQPAQAAALYRQVAADKRASKQQQALAKARLAQLQRLSAGAVTQARAELDAAAAALQAGHIDRASAALTRAQSTGANLGWFDRQRLNRMVTVVRDRQVAQAKQLAAVQPTPKTASVAPAPAPQRNADQLEHYRLLVAQERLAQGDKALANGQVELAIRRYEQAQELDPKNEQVVAQLAAARARQTQQAATQGPQSLISRTEASKSLARQQTEAAFKADIDRAQDLLNAANYRAAQDAVVQARAELNSAHDRGVLPDVEYNAMLAQSQKINEQITQAQARALNQRQQQATVENRKNQAVTRIQSERQKDQQIQQLLRRAMDLRLDMQYDKALELVNQALFIEPTNIAAQAMKVGIQDVQIAVNDAAARRQRALAIANLSVENTEATIPSTDLVIYPSDWPQLTKLRAANLSQNVNESEVNRRVRAKLQETVPVNFDNNHFSQVIDYFRSTTGVNFFVNWAKLQSVGVSRDKPVTLKLSNIPAEQALHLVLKQIGTDVEPVGYSIIQGIVTISTERDLRQTTDTRVYDIRDLLVQIPNFDNAPEFSLQDALGDDSGGGSSGSGGGGGGGVVGANLFGDNNNNQNQKPTGPTRAELIKQITGLLQDTVGKQDEWQAYGGSVSSIRELNGNLIIKTTPNNHRQVVKLLSQLRETRAIQISVEARFLLVSQDFLEEIGVDLDVQLNNIGGNFGPITIAQDSVNLAKAVPGANAPTNWTDPGILPGTNTPGVGFTPTSRSLNFGVSYFDDLQVNLLIKATQAHQNAITLTAPRVTFVNGQRAFVVLARQIAFVSDLTPIPDADGFKQTLSVVNSGAVLDVQGTVSADHRYVTLTLQPSLATVKEPIRQIPQQAVVNNNNNNGDVTVTTDDETQVVTAFLEAPELELTSVKATVSVPDKGTLLLGGQRLVQETQVEAGVPVLSKIPYLNRLFTNTSTTKDERTLLILIKPTIIIAGEQEENLFPGLNQNPAAYSIGHETR